MGRNSKARREAKKRKKAQNRGPRPRRQPLTFAYDTETGQPVDLKQRPWEYIYYDEPDFSHYCPSCGEIVASPIFSMRLNPAYIVEYGEFVGGPSFGHTCPHCGVTVGIQPREETSPDGTALYTVDRDVLLAAGLREWSPGHSVFTLVHRETGEEIQISMSAGSHELLVVCDDCGLPWAHREKQQAITTADDSELEFEINAGPCEHCGGFGKPLTTKVSDGGFTTVSTSPVFANQVLSALAERVRSGDLDVTSAVRELRTHGGGPYRALADWIEARPTISATVASALITSLATIAAPQVPVFIGGGSDAPQQHQQPGTYNEDQVTEIIEKVLDHYDRTHGLSQRRRDHTKND